MNKNYFVHFCLVDYVIHYVILFSSTKERRRKKKQKEKEIKTKQKQNKRKTVETNAKQRMNDFIKLRFENKCGN